MVQLCEGLRPLARRANQVVAVDRSQTCLSGRGFTLSRYESCLSLDTNPVMAESNLGDVQHSFLSASMSVRQMQWLLGCFASQIVQPSALRKMFPLHGEGRG